MAKETNKGLLGITAAGALEGALVAIPFGAPASSIFGGIVGGATAYSAERFMQAKREKSNEIPGQPTVAETVAGPNTLVDVTVETTSMTKRTDVPEEASQPIVKSNREQATGVSLQDLPNALASIREQTRANVFPTWQTTLQEKTTASALDTAAYEHRAQRVS